MGFIDRLHGTDKQFVESKQAERHLRILSLASARELVPDNPDKANRKKMK